MTGNDWWFITALNPSCDQWSVIENKPTVNNSNRFLQACLGELLEKIPQPAYIKDSERRFVDCNSAFARRVGISRADINGKRSTDLIQDADATQNSRIDSLHLFQSPAAEGDHRGVTAEAQLWKLPLTETELFDDSNSVIGIIGLLDHGLLEQRLIGKLQAAERRAEVADRIKTEFLANLNHEIRASLNAITGFCHQLQDAELPAEMPDSFFQHIDFILKSADELSEQMVNILDLARIRSGRNIEASDDINPRILIKGIYHLYRAEAAVRNLDFNYDPAPDLPESIKINRTVLNQILIAIIETVFNAASVDDPVRLSTTMEDQHLLFQIRFKLNSSTIDPLFKKQRMNPEIDDALQEAVQAGDKCLDPRKLTEQAGGQFSIQQEMDGCISVNVKFPSTVKTDPGVESALKPENGHHSAADKKVLVIEDSSVMQNMLRKVFNKLGIAFRIVDNGNKIIDIIDKFQPDLILSDFHLPDLDGFGICRQIRSIEHGTVIPIVIMTGDTRASVRDSLNPYNVSEFLYKPIKMNQLYSILNRYILGEENCVREPENSLESCFSEAELTELRLDLNMLSKIPVHHPEKAIDQLSLMRKKYANSGGRFVEDLHRMEQMVFNGDIQGLSRIIAQYLPG